MMRKKVRRVDSVRRRILLEKMEVRLPLAADTGHNFLMPVDVNDDGQVRTSDALAIINALATQSYEGEGSVVDAQSADAGIASMYFDVNDDGQASPSDAIRVINHLARSVDSNEAAEVLVGADEARARIELEYKSNGRVEFQVRITGSSPDQSLDVTVGGAVVGQIQTDGNGRGKLELKFGGNSTPVPDAIANATSMTEVAIGDVVSGNLGSLGEIGASDGGSDEISDGSSDEISDGSSDEISDGGSDEISDGGSDEISDGGSDEASGQLSDGGSDGSSDGLSDDELDGRSDGGSDGDDDDVKDGGSDGDSDDHLR